MAGSALVRLTPDYWKNSVFSLIWTFRAKTQFGTILAGSGPLPESASRGSKSATFWTPGGTPPWRIWGSDLLPQNPKNSTLAVPASKSPRSYRPLFKCGCAFFPGRTLGLHLGCFSNYGRKLPPLESIHYSTSRKGGVFSCRGRTFSVFFASGARFWHFSRVCPDFSGATRRFPGGKKTGLENANS